MSAERAQPLPGGPLAAKDVEHWQEISMLARFLDDANDEEAARWVERRAAAARAVATPNEQLEEIRQQMEADHRRARRLSGVPIDAHADQRKAKEQMYAEALKRGQIRDWRES